MPMRQALSVIGPVPCSACHHGGVSVWLAKAGARLPKASAQSMLDVTFHEGPGRAAHRLDPTESYKGTGSIFHEAAVDICTALHVP